MYDIAPFIREIISISPLVALEGMKKTLETAEKKDWLIQRVISDIDKEISKRNTKECVK